MPAHPISMKILALDISTKMLLEYEITVFLNQHYFKNELIDCPNDLTASIVKNSSQQHGRNS